MEHVIVLEFWILHLSKILVQLGRNDTFCNKNQKTYIVARVVRRGDRAGAF